VLSTQFMSYRAFKAKLYCKYYKLIGISSLEYRIYRKQKNMTVKLVIDWMNIE